MLKRRLLTLIVVISIVMVLITTLVVGRDTVAEWLEHRLSEIFIAAVFAIVAGVIIHYVYIKITPKPKLSQTTVVMKPRKVSAKLVLPNNNEVKITEDEKILGREDFVGVVSADDLSFIGRKHFDIIRMNDGVYIEDLDTKNGTTLNGEAIKGQERRKLKAGDEILVAKVLRIRYVQEQAS